MSKKQQSFLFMIGSLLCAGSLMAVLHECRTLYADRRLHKAGLLNNFRSASEPYLYEIIPEPTRDGLDSLAISTSEQLTEKELVSLKQRLNNPSKLLILDLRLQSDVHGFINGEPVQFQSNEGTVPAPSGDHEAALSEQLSACPKVYITDRQVRGMQGAGILMDIETIHTESEIARLLGYAYQRLPLDTSKSPEPEFVDTFVTLIDAQTEDSWIHIHDNNGLVGPSVLFVMADMLKNAQRISYEEILMRHIAFGGVDFIQKRYTTLTQFLKQFYQYARAKAQQAGIVWSQWIKNNA